MGEGVEVVVREVDRYVGSGCRSADASDAVAIGNAVRVMGRMEAAKRRYLSGDVG